MEENMSDPGLTSEQRAAIAVHNATQNRMCLNLSGNGQICVACSEVADQIDAAVEVERQRSQEALAAAEARAEKADAKAAQYERDWYAAKSEFGTAMAKSREALAAARRECEGLRKALEEVDSLFIRQIAVFLRFPERPEDMEDWIRGRVYDARIAIDKLRKARAALAAPAAGEEGKHGQ